jgi:hypothetical protein
MDRVLFGKGVGEGAVIAGWGAPNVEVGRAQLFTEGNENCSVMRQVNWRVKRCGLAAVLTFNCDRCH